jgi:hypothetical protein
LQREGPAQRNTSETPHQKELAERAISALRPDFNNSKSQKEVTSLESAAAGIGPMATHWFSLGLLRSDKIFSLYPLDLSRYRRYALHSVERNRDLSPDKFVS